MRAAIAQNLAKYCPHKPWPKQRLFLELDFREILFGGAKGPGKTDALLMAALRYVHVPGYACLILRVTTKEARQANSIMDRLQRWTANTDAKWNLTDSFVRFPSGAFIKFGYIANMQDAYQFQSSEYQTIIWDELTDFPLGENAESNPYLFMFGMNRKPTVGVNPWLELVPLQILAGTNPGGRSHAWVRDRFISDEALEALSDPTPKAFSKAPGRAYIPALIADNPAIDGEKYVRESLSHLGPVTRARFVAGDWSVHEDGVIPLEWLKHFDVIGGTVFRPLGPDNSPLAAIDASTCLRFAVVDCAATSEAKARENKGRGASYSVISIFDYHRLSGRLFWTAVDRGRWDFPQLQQRVLDACGRWMPGKVLIENEKTGLALLQSLSGRAPVRGVSHEGKDKLARAAPLLQMFHDGRIFIPRPGAAAWVDALINELLAWRGLDDEAADQIDTGAYAAKEVGSSAMQKPIVLSSLMLY